MSASFYITYAGSPVAFSDGEVKFVSERQADKFISEADAWHAAARNNLNPQHCAMKSAYQNGLAAAVSRRRQPHDEKSAE